MHLPTFLLMLGVTAISCSTPTTSTTTEETPAPEVMQYTPCRYWCIYKRPYCCDDGSLAIPPDHLQHLDLDCAPVEEQICKSTGIFLNNTSPAMVLAKGDPKKQVWCASDGYCQEDQRCCPSPCVRRHLCMAGLKREAVVQEQSLLGDELEMEEEEYLPEE